MANKRSWNVIGGQRVDTQHMRSIESAIQNDYDELLKTALIGSGDGYIVRGMRINMTNAIGASASALQVLVADSAILHPTSAVAGTFYLSPTTAAPEILNSTINANVQGSFTPNAINYIGIEYERNPDDTTQDTVYIWDPTSKTETQKVLPIAKVLKYKFIITTSIWAANVLPLAKVTTDSVNNVTDITDQRELLGRLGKAGRNTPDPTYVYPWTEGRVEAPVTATNNSQNPFAGGDKQIGSIKEWMDTIMSSLLEIKGTVSWYSPLTSGSLETLRMDLGNTIITGTGTITHDENIDGRMNWSSDVFLKVIGSRLQYKILTNPVSTDITLADNQVAYLTLVRGVAITPNLIWTNSSAVVTSVGAVAWTAGLTSGDFIKKSSETDAQYYQILSVDSASQVTLTENFGGTSTGPTGTKSKYSWGVYQTTAVPTTNRHIRVADREDVPVSENTVWLFIREDNGGLDPIVYFKLTGEEIEQGEEIDITDTVSKNIIQYIGATGQAQRLPIYSIKLGAVVAQVQTATVGAGGTITSGQSFRINAGENTDKFQIWFDVNTAGGLVPQPGMIPVQVSILNTDTAIQVGAALASAINGIAGTPFAAVDNLDGTVTITNIVLGVTAAPANIDVGAPFALAVDVVGTGTPNKVVADGDDLTRGIKKLDDAVGDILEILDESVYNETLYFVAVPAADNESAPVLSGNQVTLPPNTRNNGAGAKFIVGAGRLEVFLNGQRINLGEDYSEFGVTGTESNKITVLQDIKLDDELIFVINLSNGSIETGGGGGGGSSAGPVGSVQLSDGSSGFTGNSSLSWDGTTLTSNSLKTIPTSGSIALNDNQVAPATIISYAAATRKFAIIEYSIERGSTLEVGRMLVTSNGALVGFNVDNVDTSPTGIVFTANIVLGNVIVQYTSTNTGSSGTFKYSVRHWN